MLSDSHGQAFVVSFKHNNDKAKLDESWGQATTGLHRILEASDDSSKEPKSTGLFKSSNTRQKGQQ